MADTTDLSTLFLTFNCAREPINTNYFAASVVKTLSSQLPPDLIVLSLQEIAPISYSFLGGSFVAPYLDKFAEAFDQAWSTGSGQYETVLNSNLGMTAIILLAKPEVASNIKWIETGGAGVGWWEMGNKGAVGARLGYAAGDESEEVVLTFVAAHLTHMEEAVERRNQDWKAINENLVFGRVPQAVDARTKAIKDPSEETEPLLSSATDGGPSSAPRSRKTHTLISPSSYTFFGGDLNYRTSDLPPHPDDHLTWPKPNDAPHDSQHYSQLMDKDQLSRERSAGRTLHHLTEAPINFAPTYKYSSKAQDQVKRAVKSADNKVVSDLPTEIDGLWAKHRIPSWCDRVLYLDPPFEQNKVKIHSYTSLPLQPTSDHQPVALSFSIPLKALPSVQGEPWVSSPFTVRRDWAAYRKVARRREIAVGLGAYIALTWEGRTLFIGTVLALIGAWAALRSLLAG